MNELAQQVQQAYDRGGRDEARKTFLETCVERDWTKRELEEALEVFMDWTRVS